MNGTILLKLPDQTAPTGPKSMQKSPLSTLLSSRSGVRVPSGVPFFKPGFPGLENQMQRGRALLARARPSDSLIKRVPSGVPLFLERISAKLHMVDIAQLVSASDCGSEGRGFDSHHPPHKVPISS